MTDPRASTARDGTLHGSRIVVTRARDQAPELVGRLRALGADVVAAPAIRIEPPASWGDLDRGLTSLEAVDWVVLTSVNGVRFVAERLTATGVGVDALAERQVAAVGPGTADALAALGVLADLVPSTHTTVALGEAFPSGTGRVLLPRAADVDHRLDDLLTTKGWTVERVVAYRLVGEEALPTDARAAILAGDVDAITFASGGTVRAFMAALDGAVPNGVAVVCIGPVSADAARDAGLDVTAVATEHTIDGLVDAVVETFPRAGDAR